MTIRSYIQKSMMLLCMMFILILSKIELFLEDVSKLIGISILTFLTVCMMVWIGFYFNKLGVFYSLEDMKYVISSKEKLIKYRRDIVIRILLAPLVVIFFLFNYNPLLKYLPMLVVVYLIWCGSEVVEYLKIKKILGYE